MDYENEKKIINDKIACGELDEISPEEIESGKEELFRLKHSGKDLRALFKAQSKAVEVNSVSYLFYRF